MRVNASHTSQTCARCGTRTLGQLVSLGTASSVSARLAPVTWLTPTQTQLRWSSPASPPAASPSKRRRRPGGEHLCAWSGYRRRRRGERCLNGRWIVKCAAPMGKSYTDPVLATPREHSPGRVHGRRLLGEPRAGRLGLGRGPGRPFAAGAEASLTNQRMEIRPSSRRCGPRRSARGPQRLDLRRQLLPRPVVGELAGTGWINRQKKPVANRDLWEPLISVTGAGPRDHLHLGQGPQRRPDERRRRPPGGGGLADPAAPAPATAPRGRRARPGRPARPVGTPACPAAGWSPSSATGPRSSAATARTRWRPGSATAGRDPGGQEGAAPRPVDADRPAARGGAAGGGGGPRGRRPLRGRPALPGAGEPWPSSSRDRYADLIRHAGAAVLLERTAPDSKQKFGAALARRDAWLARHADEALVVWDGKDPALGQAGPLARGQPRRRRLDRRPQRLTRRLSGRGR